MGTAYLDIGILPWFHIGVLVLSLDKDLEAQAYKLQVNITEMIKI